MIHAMVCIFKRIIYQQQQHVAVGPGNAHFISIRQVSSKAATLRRGMCGHWHAAAADTALGNLPIKN